MSFNKFSASQAAPNKDASDDKTKAAPAIREPAEQNATPAVGEPTKQDQAAPAQKS